MQVPYQVWLDERVLSLKIDDPQRRFGLSNPFDKGKARPELADNPVHSVTEKDAPSSSWSHPVSHCQEKVGGSLEERDAQIFYWMVGTSGFCVT